MCSSESHFCTLIFALCLVSHSCEQKTDSLFALQISTPHSRHSFSTLLSRFVTAAEHGLEQNLRLDSFGTNTFSQPGFSHTLVGARALSTLLEPYFPAQEREQNLLPYFSIVLLHSSHLMHPLYHRTCTVSRYRSDSNRRSYPFYKNGAMDQLGDGTIELPGHW